MALGKMPCCFRYHKSTDFQANHNVFLLLNCRFFVVLDTTKVQIFKQITTEKDRKNGHISCFRYHKSTDFQANHNKKLTSIGKCCVVLDTTKVQIFKQITTAWDALVSGQCCFRYHKSTDFQANHNFLFVYVYFTRLF